MSKPQGYCIEQEAYSLRSWVPSSLRWDVESYNQRIRCSVICMWSQHVRTAFASPQSSMTSSRESELEPGDPCRLLHFSTPSNLACAHVHQDNVFGRPNGTGAMPAIMEKSHTGDRRAVCNASCCGKRYTSFLPTSAQGIGSVQATVNFSRCIGLRRLSFSLG